MLQDFHIPINQIRFVILNIPLFTKRLDESVRLFQIVARERWEQVVVDYSIRRAGKKKK